MNYLTNIKIVKLVYFLFSVSKSYIKTFKNISQLANADPENLIEIETDEFETENSKLPTYIFEELESELTNIIIVEGSQEETDGAFDVIRNILEKVKIDFEKLAVNGDLNKFLHTISKIFTLLLNIKVDTSNKILKIVKLTNALILKKWSEQNQFQKE